MSAMIVGSTVRRSAGPWTPAGHALLRHFEAVAFDGAPRAIEVRDGVEVVSYVDGERSYDDADGVVFAVGRLVRATHNAQDGFATPRPDDDAARHGLPTDRRGERLRLPLDGYDLTEREGFLDLVATVRHSWRDAYALWGRRERRERWSEAYDAGRYAYIDANLEWLEANRDALWSASRSCTAAT